MTQPAERIAEQSETKAEDALHDALTRIKRLRWRFIQWHRIAVAAINVATVLLIVSGMMEARQDLVGGTILGCALIAISALVVAQGLHVPYPHELASLLDELQFARRNDVNGDSKARFVSKVTESATRIIREREWGSAGPPAGGGHFMPSYSEALRTVTEELRDLFLRSGIVQPGASKTVFGVVLCAQALVFVYADRTASLPMDSTYRAKMAAYERAMETYRPIQEEYDRKRVECEKRKVESREDRNCYFSPPVPPTEPKQEGRNDIYHALILLSCTASVAGYGLLGRRGVDERSFVKDVEAVGAILDSVVKDKVKAIAGVVRGD